MVKDSPSISVPPSYWSRMRGPWRVVGFRWYWMTSATQSVAQGMQFFALVWLVLDLTGSSLQLTGLVVFLYGIPNTVLLPLGGVIADRLNRKYLLMATQAGVGVVMGLVAALTLTDAIVLWHIYVAVAMLGVLQALNQPARVTMLSDLVGHSSLLDAVAQFSASIHIGRIVGPPLLGMLIDGIPGIADLFDIWSIGTGLLANAAFYGFSVLLLIPIRWSSSAEAPAREPLVQNFINGISVIKNTPVLLTVIVLACSFGGFGMSHLQVIPAFAKDQLGSGRHPGGRDAAGLRHRLFDGEPRADFHEPRLALPLAVGLSRDHGSSAHDLRLVNLLLGCLGAVPHLGNSQPGHRLASVDDYPPAGGPRRGARPGDGHPSLHPGFPLPVCLATRRCRRRGGLATGDNRRRRADACS